MRPRDDGRVVVSVVTMTDASVAASAAMQLARDEGFAPRATAEIGIAVRELATNIVRHAGRGEVEVAFRAPDLVVCARNPGGAAPALASAMTSVRSVGIAVSEDGRVRAGLGAGTSAVRRMTDEVEVDLSGGRVEVRARRRKV